MLMIWSSLARNKSPSPVTFVCLGRIVTSDATTESRPPIRGNPENEIASFRRLKHRKLAIPKPPPCRKSNPAQWLGSFFTADYGGARPWRDFPLLAQAYLDGRLLLDELITQRISLSAINDGFAALRSGKAIRSVVMFD